MSFLLPLRTVAQEIYPPFRDTSERFNRRAIRANRTTFTLGLGVRGIDLLIRTGAVLTYSVFSNLQPPFGG